MPLNNIVERVFIPNQVQVYKYEHKLLQETYTLKGNYSYVETFLSYELSFICRNISRDSIDLTLLINEESQEMDGESFNKTIYYIGQVLKQGEQGKDEDVYE